ncbi:AAA family ATPase [Archangium lansingense]|uniref:ATP-binding protein n=1 Tax=Archangium lansingense TaxID=2995310 RepID=A0ABT3ZVM3_9BACT|nr:ATP-binding protein [Archangium lansinium]MCY1073453.1 ATP-binding protein [Archangium lansinium]
MTEGDIENPDLANEPQIYLKAASFDGWPTPRAKANTTLSAQRTILVGRNGAGKSLLIDGLYSAARACIGPSPRTVFNIYEAPPSFSFEFSLQGGNETLVLSTQWQILDQSNDTDITTKPLNRTERCWIAETNETLWSLEKEVATLANGSKIPVPPSLGLLSFGGRAITDERGYARKLRAFLRGIRRIDAGLPRLGRKEFEIIRPTSAARVGLSEVSGKRPSRVGRLARHLVDAFERKADVFGEFAALANQLGLAKTIDVETVTLKPSADGTSAESGMPEPDRFFLVSFDGVNIGQLSDGTLRVAEILWTLVSLRPNEMLLLEEPETGIHPGLLKKLLSVIESYTMGRQIVISTHSIQVVNWANADEIRLVAREDAVVTSHGLRTEQLERVSRYLQDEGTLADFLYSGGADE